MNKDNCGICKKCTGQLKEVTCPKCGSNKAKYHNAEGIIWECENGHIYTPPIDWEDIKCHTKMIERLKEREIKRQE